VRHNGAIILQFYRLYHQNFLSIPADFIMPLAVCFFLQLWGTMNVSTVIGLFHFWCLLLWISEQPALLSRRTIFGV